MVEVMVLGVAVLIPVSVVMVLVRVLQFFVFEQDPMVEVMVLGVAVLIPVSVVMVFVSVLQFFVFEHVGSSKSPEAEIVKEGQVVIGGVNLWAGANFNPAKSFRASEDQSLASSSWCRLPEDLVIDQILSRLPVKSLMRFKSVCKGWHALLSTRCFIASHLKYIDTPKRLVSWNGNNNGLLVGHDAFHVFAECCFRRNFQPLNLNFGFDRKPDLVLGPCDGLFCLYWRATSNFTFRELENEVNVERLPTIALWNPATRAFSILPMSNFDFPPYRRAAYCMVGFGFDLTTRSIKVVKVLTLSRAEASHCEFINCAEVYDLGSGSWRFLHLDDVVKDVALDDELIVSMYNKNDGVFHWRCQLWHTDCVYEVVLSFDMSTELFHMTPLPDKYNEYMVHCDRLKECKFALLRDSLALICSFFDWPYPDEEGHTTVEVWVMKKDFDCMVEAGESFDCMVEAGESSSPYRYSHELTVEPRLPGPCLSTGFWNKNELLIWKDVDELRAGRSPFLYDIVTKQVRDVEISGELNFMYRESLVSVKGGCGNE